MKKIIYYLFLFLFGSSMFLTSCSTNTDEVETQKEKVMKAEASLVLNFSKAGLIYKIERWVFNRENGANGLGHVGCGFRIMVYSGSTVLNKIYYFGGVENPFGSPYIATGSPNGGFWSEALEAAAMKSIMKKTYGYNRFKIYSSVELTSNQVGEKIQAIQGFPNRGYALAGNNCLNATYDVIQLYGSGLPVPQPSYSALLYAPNNWYGSLLPILGWSPSYNL